MIVLLARIVPKGFRTITLWPFILLRYKSDTSNKMLINHERIHLRQQIELLVVFFYVWYTLEFLLRIIQYQNKHLAYRNISFEREAYQNEKNLNYLENRKFWGFIAYR